MSTEEEIELARWKRHMRYAMLKFDLDRARAHVNAIIAEMTELRKHGPR